MNVGRPAVTYTDTCNLKSDTCLESVNLELRTAMLGDLAGRGVLNRGVLLLCIVVVVIVVGLFSSLNILQIVDVVCRVDFLLFLPCF